MFQWQHHRIIMTHNLQESAARFTYIRVTRYKISSKKFCNGVRNSKKLKKYSCAKLLGFYELYSLSTGAGEFLIFVVLRVSLVF